MSSAAYCNEAVATGISLSFSCLLSSAMSQNTPAVDVFLSPPPCEKAKLPTNLCHLRNIIWALNSLPLPSVSFPSIHSPSLKLYILNPDRFGLLLIPNDHLVSCVIHNRRIHSWIGSRLSRRNRSQGSSYMASSHAGASSGLALSGGGSGAAESGAGTVESAPGEAASSMTHRVMPKTSTKEGARRWRREGITINCVEVRTARVWVTLRLLGLILPSVSLSACLLSVSTLGRNKFNAENMNYESRWCGGYFIFLVAEAPCPFPGAAGRDERVLTLDK